jgi:xanthine dehydrogenase/oxidase
MGLIIIEEMIWSNKEHPWVRRGHLFSRSPGVYKIPSFNDVPVVFNVHLLDNAPNNYAVYRSKAVGEPLLFLAASIFFTIKDAIRSARLDYWTKDKKNNSQRHSSISSSNNN